MDNFILRLYDTLTPEMNKLVQDFRTSVSDMNGTVRTQDDEINRFEKYCSEGDIYKWILVFEEGVIIGMAVIFRRAIVYNKIKISLGGIGKIRVREDRRRRGVATIMMNESMKQLFLAECDVAFLSTNTDSFLAAYYQKFGFIQLNKPYVFKGFSGTSYIEQNGMIAPVRSKEIYQMIQDTQESLDIGKGNW